MVLFTPISISANTKGNHRKFAFASKQVASQLTSTHSSQWRIQGGGGGVNHPPQRDPILSFLHTFPPKSAPQWVSAPQQEILDPQLLAMLFTLNVGRHQRRTSET